jgi:hypothetical protein
MMPDTNFNSTTVQMLMGRPVGGGGARRAAWSRGSPDSTGNNLFGTDYLADVGTGLYSQAAFAHHPGKGLTFFLDGHCFVETI